MKIQKLKSHSKHLMITAFSMLFLLSFSLSAQQQGMPAPQQQPVKEDFSETELKKFIEANKETAQIQQKGQGKMVKAIQEEGLDINTFNQIMTSMQNPDKKPEASKDDLEKFDDASKKVIEIQQDVQSEMTEAIEENGMKIEEYKEILLAYQHSPKVQKELNALLEKENGN